MNDLKGYTNCLTLYKLMMMLKLQIFSKVTVCVTILKKTNLLRSLNNGFIIHYLSFSTGGCYSSLHGRP